MDKKKYKKVVEELKARIAELEAQLAAKGKPAARKTTVKKAAKKVKRAPK